MSPWQQHAVFIIFMFCHAAELILLLLIYQATERSAWPKDNSRG
jgi:hypothetical protein